MTHSRTNKLHTFKTPTPQPSLQKPSPQPQLQLQSLLPVLLKLLELLRLHVSSQFQLYCYTRGTLPYAWKK